MYRILIDIGEHTRPAYRLAKIARSVLATAMAIVGGLVPVSASASSITIDFETTPSMAAQPGTFALAGPARTVGVSDGGLVIAAISGGNVLGNPNFLASFVGHGSPPNLYGTAFIGGPTYTNAITLEFNPLIAVSNITAVLFNGETDLETFTATAFSGSTRVSQQTFSDVPDSSDPNSFRNTSLTSIDPIHSPITSEVISATGTFASTSFDFFVDNITVTYTTIPEPNSLVLLGLGTSAVGLVCWKRQRTKAA